MRSIGIASHRVSILVLFLALVAGLFHQAILRPVLAGPASDTRENYGATITNEGSAPVVALTETDVNAFLDATIPVQLETTGTPGAAVVVVQNGRILAAKGYGYADLAARRAVDADKTLFRTGSSGKLFTWTAVMQLVEQGKLDLHADVNRYLSSFQLPETFPEPITLAHLLTHTAGFEELNAGLQVRTPAELQPIGEWAADNIPARVLPPGTRTAYSNYGVVLAAHIVEQVSGIPFEHYLEQYIFAPLNMERSTARQPVPAALAADLAVGYMPGANGVAPWPFETFQMWPAGGMSNSVTDMARFMIAHLNYGKLDGAQILREDTTRIVRAR